MIGRMTTSTATATETLAAFRDRFPYLDRVTHFVSCSQGAVSVDLERMLDQMRTDLISDPAPWGRWMDLVETLRRRFAGRIGADPSQIALAPNASIAAFQVRSTLPAGVGRTLVTSDHEFPSVGHVWRATEDSTKIRSLSADRVLDADAWSESIDESVGLVSAPLVSYANGCRPPVAEIGEAAHAVGAKMFVDAYQGTGVVPFTVDELGCDYLVTGSLKYLLGLPGLAFLYVREPAELADPALTGWFGRRNPFAFDAEAVDYPEVATRFETGTPGVPSIYAALGGLDALDTIDPAVGWAHVQELTARTAAELRELGETIDRPDSPDAAGPQVALVDDDVDHLGAWLLDNARISTAPRGSRLRISFHYYSSHADVDRLVDAIRAYRRR
jgi:selenocysteine lyase/cysteine desulfurase